MEAASGEVAISAGDVEAVITLKGAILRGFSVAGVLYTETFPSGGKPPLSSGTVLVPWPNRVAGAEYTRDGVRHTLEATEPARGNAIHGLVRNKDWTVVEQSADSVRLRVSVDTEPGWPFPFDTEVAYTVHENGITVRHGVSNTGDAVLPFGVGTHPFPRPGKADADGCLLRLAATTHLPLDPERMVPTGGEVPIDPALSAGVPLREVTLDDAFGGCVPGADGVIRHTLTGPDGGVEVWADAAFSWVQVFTPPEFPGKDGGRAVAIEPMTCPPDALNSGTGLIELAPGASWSAEWGIAPLSSAG